MKKVSVLIISIIFLLGCDSIDSPKKPKNLISETKMVNILVDISLLNAAKGSNKIKLQEEGVNPEEYIFKKHEIDSIQFKTSNSYYAHNVIKYEEIYTKVNDSLKALQIFYEDLAKKEAAEKKRKADSLKEIRFNKIKLDTTSTLIRRPDSLRQRRINEKLIPAKN